MRAAAAGAPLEDSYIYVCVRARVSFGVNVIELISGYLRHNKNTTLLRTAPSGAVVSDEPKYELGDLCVS